MTRGGGIQLDDDLTRWEFWWEFNKDPFIRLREAIHKGGIVTGSDEFFLGSSKKGEAKDMLRPTDDDKINNILPALKKALDATKPNDININSSCMVAMAKVGKDRPDDFKLVDVFARRLKENNQEIRETAALSIGIAAIPAKENVDLLIGLATNNDLGKKASGGSEVNERTRSFAAYGLGLVAYLNANLDKTDIFAALKSLVADEKMSSRNIKVAAVNALGLLNISGDSDANKALLADVLKCLEDYYQKNVGAGEQMLQAHCPTAIAKLINRDHEKADYYKEMFAAEIEGKNKQKRSNLDLGRSAVLALGQLCKPIQTDKDSDAKYGKLLLETYRDHKDQQTRNFATIALGQIGGDWSKLALISEFDKAKKSIEKPWLAVSLGVLAFKRWEAETAAGRTPEPDRQIGRTLQDALKDVKDPSALSAFAIGLGLSRYKDAADELRKMLLSKASQDALAGYICIGLALMDDTTSTEDIRGIVNTSVRRPDRLKQAAIALGKLGDKTVADELQKLLNDGDNNLAKLSAVASALGFIGDRRTIEPIKTMLFDDKIAELSRAFAAVALGGVGDKEMLPWNSKIARDLNYRAAVETLTDKTAGVLDIL